jgi:hypothetical protein
MKGTFRAKAKSWGLGESGTGKEQIAINFDILTEGAEFKSLNWYGYFTEDALERTVESMRHCGWTGVDVADLSGLDTNEVDLVVDEEEYQGKLQTKVKWVNRVGGLALKAPLTDERAKAFGAALRDKIKALDAGKSSRPAAARPALSSRGGALPPEPPPHQDADIPF